MPIVALDVTGGDLAPEATLRGACLAVEEQILDASDLLLVGPEPILRDRFQTEALLASCPHLYASQNIGMNEHPVESLRRKRDSTIVKGITSIRDGQAKAFVSAGNTGAMVAAATVLLRLLPGVNRPGIAITTHALGHPCTVIDVGANAKCRPLHLAQFAVLATAYAQSCLGVADPTVGILSIGVEDKKGNELVHRTRKLLEAMPAVHCIGNVEGMGIFTGKADVVVCEGFVGNAILKSCEGLGEYLLETLRQEFTKHDITDAEKLALRRVLARIAQKLDYAAYGGALMLGIDGVCVIGHGRSERRAIANAIRVAIRAVREGLNHQILQSLDQGAGAR